MNRRACLAAIVLASLAAACSGGGNIVVIPPPPPQGNFSNASLNGRFAFSMTGTEVCGLSSSFFGRIGSFTADGNGHITGGVEDVNTCTGGETLQFTNSTYSIQADGRGILDLTNVTGTTHYSITLSTTSAGYIIQTDVNSTAGGSFQKQNPAAFSITQIANGYVFDFSGVSANVPPQPESIIGRFTADGAGGISSGQFDKNQGGTPTGPFLFAGSYLLDPTFGADGRGTAVIAGQNLVFYIVDATRLKFISSDLDFPAALVGDAFAQQPNPAFNLGSVNGSFAFLIGGAITTTNTIGPIVTAGRFTADGAGNLSAIVLDENNNGSRTQLPNGTVTGSYTVDPNGLGGGTMTWSDSIEGRFDFVFYLISPDRAVFQETDTGITSDGSIFRQTSGAISNAALAGDHAFIWTGVSTDEEDFVGHLKLTAASSNNVTGTMDFNEFGPAKQFFNFPISGALTLGSNPAARNTYQVTANAPPNPAVTFTFSAYVVDANTVLLVGTDTNRVVAGNITHQP